MCINFSFQSLWSIWLVVRKRLRQFSCMFGVPKSGILKTYTVTKTTTTLKNLALPYFRAFSKWFSCLMFFLIKSLSEPVDMKCLGLGVSSRGSISAVKLIRCGSWHLEIAAGVHIGIQRKSSKPPATRLFVETKQHSLGLTNYNSDAFDEELDNFLKLLLKTI